MADVLHLWIVAGVLVTLLAGVVLASAGASFGVCLVVVMLAPWVAVVAYETVGHRRLPSVQVA